MKFKLWVFSRILSLNNNSTFEQLKLIFNIVKITVPTQVKKFSILNRHYNCMGKFEIYFMILS